MFHGIEEKEFQTPNIDSITLAFMYRDGTRYPQLQFSFMMTITYGPDTVFQGKFPLMRNAGDETYHGWTVDPDAPAAFWFARRREILEGTAEDEFFVPVIPDMWNIARHPIAVAKASRMQARARREHGDGFRWVFTVDPADPERENCIVKLYVFLPKLISLDEGDDRLLLPTSSL